MPHGHGSHLTYGHHLTHHNAPPLRPQCVTCNCCRAGPVFDIVMAAATAAWWLVAAILLDREAGAADAMGVPAQDWRTGEGAAMGLHVLRCAVLPRMLAVSFWALCFACGQAN